MRFIILITLALYGRIGFGQEFYITGATIHIGNGKVFEQGIIQVLDGKINMVADARLIKLDLRDKTVINASGKHIYPGVIAPNSQLGLQEIEEVKATLDFKEIGVFNPNIRSVIAYNTDSEVVKTIKSNGILFTQIVPLGGIISGSSSVVKTEAWDWEDALVKADDGIHLWWPSRFSGSESFDESGELKENESYNKTIGEIEAFLKEAKAYAQAGKQIVNLKFEATKGLFNGSQNLYVHVDLAKEMISAIGLVEELAIEKLVIVGGNEALEISDLLKEKEISVILGSIHRLPIYQQSDVDEAFKLPAALQKAGVKYCISYKKVWEQRSLIFLAGTAAAYGLTKEEALSAITKNTAEILGLENLGTLEIGKDATFIVSKGDILDMRTSIVERAFIAGKEINLHNRQKDLEQKYLNKYKQEGKL